MFHDLRSVIAWLPRARQVAMAGARADCRRRGVDRSCRRACGIRASAPRRRSGTRPDGAGRVATVGDVAEQRSARARRLSRARRRHLLRAARRVPVVDGMAAAGHGLSILGRGRGTIAGALSRCRLSVSCPAAIGVAHRTDDARLRHRLRTGGRLGDQHLCRGGDRARAGDRPDACRRRPLRW